MFQLDYVSLKFHPMFFPGPGFPLVGLHGGRRARAVNLNLLILWLIFFSKNQRSKLLAKLEFGKEEVVPPKKVFVLLQKLGVSVPGDIEALQALSSRNCYDLLMLVINV